MSGEDRKHKIPNRKLMRSCCLNLSRKSYAGLWAFLLGMFPTFSDPVRLSWDYPPEELTNITFRVKWSTVITTPATNWITIVTTTNTTAIVDVPRGVNFFACTASNFWGESFFSNIASTPPVVKTNVSLHISRQ